MKVVIYGRVSTAHHGQNPEVQLVELRNYVQARGWTIVEEIIDIASGTSSNRSGLKLLIHLARSRQCDCVIIWKLDRLFRSLRHLIVLMDEFSGLGVQLVSLRDSIDLTLPSGRLLFGILGSLAEFEADLTRERTLAGLEHARRSGKKLGRPGHNQHKMVIELTSKGKSYSQTGRLLGISKAAVYRVIKASRKPPLVGKNPLQLNKDLRGDGE